MQICCTSPQTDNHASIPPLSFLQARCPFCRPTNSIKVLKACHVNTLQNIITELERRSAKHIPLVCPQLIFGNIVNAWQMCYLQLGNKSGSSSVTGNFVASQIIVYSSVGPTGKLMSYDVQNVFWITSKIFR